MISFETLVAFGFISLGMVCTPGPNMIYLISRSITQGRMAGIISLAGVVFGFIVYLSARLFGIIAIFNYVPTLYVLLKIAGAAYLLWLAWKVIKPGSASLFEPGDLSMEQPRKLFLMGFLTNLLNPKIALLYISLLPQFMNPSSGSFLQQGLALGITQIVISIIVNLLIVITASQIAAWFNTRPTWLRLQKWVMASVLTGLSFKLVIERQR